MQVKMKSTQKGSPDGITVNTYEKGEVYDLPDSLAVVFLEEGWAEKPRKTAGPTENKTDGPTEKKDE